MESTPAFLTASHTIALPADGSVPEWVHVLPADQFSGRDGRGPYRTDAASVLAAYAALGKPLTFDYEHQSINCVENGKPAPASGWGVALEDRDGAVWAKVDWNAAAAKMIAGREYRFCSPVFDYTPDGTVFRLASVALTNDPNLFLTAINRVDRPSVSPPVPAKGAAHMDMKDLLERLRYMLNLPTLATPEEVAAELDKLKAQLALPATAAMRQTLALPETAGLGELLRAAHGRISAVPDPTAFVPRGEYDRVSHSLNALQKAHDDERVEKSVTAAMTAGKVAPANAEWARAYCRKDQEGFDKFVADAPVLLPGAQTASHAAARPSIGDAENPLLADANRRAAGK